MNGVKNLLEKSSKLQISKIDYGKSQIVINTKNYQEKMLRIFVNKSLKQMSNFVCSPQKILFNFVNHVVSRKRNPLIDKYFLNRRKIRI